MQGLAAGWLQTAFSWKFLIVYVFLGSALWVHLRGRVRHKFFRQLTDHSTFLAPINALIYLTSGVPNRPYLDTKDFPSLQVLRDNWQTIRDEAAGLHDEGRVKASERYDDAGFNSFFRTGWTRFYLKWYGETLPSAQAACPKTMALLDQVKGLKAAMFTMLPPGARLVRHRDPYAGSVRYHLGLVTPNDDRCFIDVDGERYSWRDGEDVVFDETYIHFAENETDQDRLILFCDIQRPMMFAWSTAVTSYIGTKIMALSATRNEPGEKVGFINRLFGLIYPVRSFFKKVKAYNRTLYYTIKYAAIALVVVLILV